MPGCWICRPLRGQARSHTGSSVGKKFMFGTIPSVGAKLARDSGGSACQDVGCAGVIAGEPCSHTGSSVDKKLVFGTVPSVGEKLARDSGGSVCLDVGYAGVIASKLAPTLDRQWARNLCSALFLLWEQSLLAILVGQLAWMLDVPASSRASPLPHWIFSGQETCARHCFFCGSKACSR